MNLVDVDKFINGLISQNDLISRIPDDFKFKDKLDLIMECKIKNRSDLFEVIFWNFPPTDTDSHLIISRFSILEAWHTQHEEIISSFQEEFNHHRTNILYIENAIHNIPEYLSNIHLQESYIRKCFYAISAHSKKDAIKALQKLSGSENSTIAKHATAQLKRLVDV